MDTIRDGNIPKEGLFSQRNTSSNAGLGLLVGFFGLFMLKTTVVGSTQKVMKLKEVLLINFLPYQPHDLLCYTTALWNHEGLNFLLVLSTISLKNPSRRLLPSGRVLLQF